MTEEEAKEEIIDMANALQLIPNTPKGKAVSMALKALGQEPCEDAINRQAAIHCLEQLVTDMPQLKLYAQKVADAMSDLPYVYPKQKTGYWINEPGRIPKCSECGIYSDDADKGYDNYCPNCGVKMEVEE